METKIGNCYIVSGLQYGDQGKGTTVDFLVKQKQAGLVVRYGGGPQAAHHVVTKDGSWHCFSHYGSGMFWQYSKTFLSKYMLIYPQTLDRQTQVLKTKTKNPIQRLLIDQQCYVITPYHQMMSRVMQIFRSNKKGSTGLGVGQTVQQVYKSNPNYFPKTDLYQKQSFTTLQIKDLFDQQLVRKKLSKIIQEKQKFSLQLLKAPLQTLYKTLYPNFDIKRQDMVQLSSQTKTSIIKQQLKFISSDSLDNLENTLEFYKQFVKRYQLCFCKKSDVIGKTLKQGKNVVFQGSQGALLDVIYGFYPHTTKTICSADNALCLINQLDFKPNITKIGVLRCYSHRHGEGPFLPYSQQLTDKLPQLHNRYSKWQGNFKIGYLDKIALKYGIEIFQPDVLSVTNLDRIQKIQQCQSKICSSYIINKQQLTQQQVSILNKRFTYQQQQNIIRILQIKKVQLKQSFKNYELTQILKKCQPQFKDISKILQQQQTISSGNKIQLLLKYIQKITQKQIAIVSNSPTWEGKTILKQLL